VISHQLSGHPAFGQTDSSGKSAVMLLYAGKKKQIAKRNDKYK